jgi:hypothetical protein
MTANLQTAYIVDDVVVTLPGDVEAARMVAKMARDAYRDHLADLAILEHQARAKLLHRHDEVTATVESEK